jgi:hypothetical protein
MVVVRSSSEVDIRVGSIDEFERASTDAQMLGTLNPDNVSTKSDENGIRRTSKFGIGYPKSIEIQ